MLGAEAQPVNETQIAKRRVLVDFMKLIPNKHNVFV
jgi:hypothetical protein